MKTFVAAIAALFLLTSQQHLSSLAFSPRVNTSTSHTTSFLNAKHAQKAPAHHEKWQPYFDRLTKYQQEHGDCNVEGDLGEWLQDQRKQYHLLKQGKKVRLTKKRAMALERAGAIPTEDSTGEGAMAP